MNEDVPAILCHFTKLEECHIKRDYHFKLPSAFKLFQSIKKTSFFYCKINILGDYVSFVISSFLEPDISFQFR